VNHFHCAAIPISAPGFADNFARRGNLRVQTIFARRNDLAIATRELEVRPRPRTAAEVLNLGCGNFSQRLPFTDREHSFTARFLVFG
jgi:hypothetical protein